MEDFKLQPLKTHRTNQTKGVLQYLKPLLLYSLIHSPPLIIPTIRSLLLLLPKLIPTNHPFLWQQYLTGNPYHNLLSTVEHLLFLS